jgi:hypothetical protein
MSSCRSTAVTTATLWPAPQDLWLPWWQQREMGLTDSQISSEWGFKWQEQCWCWEAEETIDHIQIPHTSHTHRQASPTEHQHHQQTTIITNRPQTSPTAHKHHKRPQIHQNVPSNAATTYNHVTAYQLNQACFHTYPTKPYPPFSNSNLLIYN